MLLACQGNSQKYLEIEYVYELHTSGSFSSLLTSAKKTCPTKKLKCFWAKNSMNWSYFSIQNIPCKQCKYVNKQKSLSSRKGKKVCDCHSISPSFSLNISMLFELQRIVRRNCEKLYTFC